MLCLSLLSSSLHAPRAFVRAQPDRNVLMAEPAVDEYLAQVKANINEGDLSTRGEGWFVGQCVLVVGVLFAPNEPVAPAVEAVAGLSAIGAGCALAKAAVNDLGVSNLTPWSKPVAGNELRTSGVYSLCRHPMYTSLLCICFGLSLLTLSFERLLLTSALFTLLSLKAGQEERFLRDKHGETYSAYSADVPQLFPSVESLKNVLSSSV